MGNCRSHRASSAYPTFLPIGRRNVGGITTARVEIVFLKPLPSSVSKVRPLITQIVAACNANGPVEDLVQELTEKTAAGLKAPTADSSAGGDSKASKASKAAAGAGNVLLDVRQRDQFGFTPLCWTSFYGNVSNATALLAAGADPNLPDAEGWTPAIHAAAHGHDAVLLALIRAGARPGYTNARGQSALYKATRATSRGLPAGRPSWSDGRRKWTVGHVKCVFYLLDAGAAVGADVRGHVPRNMLRDLRAMYRWPAWCPRDHARHPREFRSVVRLLCLQRARERPFALDGRAGGGGGDRRAPLPCYATRAHEVSDAAARARAARVDALERCQPPHWREAATRACARVLALRDVVGTGTGTDMAEAPLPLPLPLPALGRGRFLGWSRRVAARVSDVADRAPPPPLTPNVNHFGIAPARALLRGTTDHVPPTEEGGGGGDGVRRRPCCLGDLPDEIFWRIVSMASTDPQTYFSRLTN